ncbi:MAG: hypothetical protein HY074_17190 [Deltaproteobacteria bacterium]|nr:hypothetical protein [Deltaproteobacteria bacterium]
MSSIIFISLLLAIAPQASTPVYAGDSVPEDADKMTEVGEFFKTIGRAAVITKDRIKNRNKPKPPHNPYDDNNPNHIPYPFANDKVLGIDGETLGLCMSLVTKAPFEYRKDKTVCVPIDLGKGKTKDPNPSTSVLSYLSGKERSCDLTSGKETQLYRIWGAMMYRMNLLPEEDFVAGLPPAHACFLDSLTSLPGAGSRAMHGLIKDWHSSALFYGEEQLKLHLYRTEEDARKYHVDKAGGDASSALVRGLWNPDLPGKKSLTVDKCLERPYLKVK